jgi:hypothetical protein
LVRRWDRNTIFQLLGIAHSASATKSASATCGMIFEFAIEEGSVSD